MRQANAAHISPYFRPTASSARRVAARRRGHHGVPEDADRHLQGPSRPSAEAMRLWRVTLAGATLAAYTALGIVLMPGKAERRWTIEAW